MFIWLQSMISLWNIKNLFCMTKKLLYHVPCFQTFYNNRDMQFVKEEYASLLLQRSALLILGYWSLCLGAELVLASAGAQTPFYSLKSKIFFFNLVKNITFEHSIFLIRMSPTDLFLFHSVFAPARLVTGWHPDPLCSLCGLPLKKMK
jgi:hypothetical protein